MFCSRVCHMRAAAPLAFFAMHPGKMLPVRAKHQKSIYKETSSKYPCETVLYLSDHESGYNGVSAVARCSAITASRGSTMQLVFAENREPLYGVCVLWASHGRAILRLTVARISQVFHVTVGRNHVALQR